METTLVLSKTTSNGIITSDNNQDITKATTSDSDDLKQIKTNFNKKHDSSTNTDDDLNSSHFDNNNHQPQETDQLDLSLKSMFNGNVTSNNSNSDMDDDISLNTNSATLNSINNNISSSSSIISNLKNKFTTNNNQQANDNIISNETNDHEQRKLLKEIRDMKQKIRKLQQEIDEKSLIITEFKDELEQTKEQYDKLKHDNLNLIQDAKQAKILRDENDILQERVLKIDQLELDIGRYKDKIVELEFFKLRNSELEDDYNKLNDSKCHVEEQLNNCFKKLDKLTELEQELDKWRNYSQEINTERDTLQARILELIDNETKLRLHNERAEDELIRLKNKLKNFQDKQEELEETNNMQLLSSCNGQINEHLAHLELSPHSTPPSSSLASSISHHHNSLELKLELEKQKQQELSDENKQLKNKLNELRQDLACEKSINDQLSRKFKNFNCTIRNIDRNFPASVTAGFNKNLASLQSVDLNKKCEVVEEEPNVTCTTANKVTSPSQGSNKLLTSIPPSTSTGHDSGFLSIEQDSNLEGQPNQVAPTESLAPVSAASKAIQELKCSNNNLSTGNEIKTAEQVINPIVVKPKKTVTTTTASTTATIAATTTTNTSTIASITATTTTDTINTTDTDKSTTTRLDVSAAASCSTVASNQSQSINPHSLCSPTKTCEIDLVKETQCEDSQSDNARPATACEAVVNIEEVQQQVCLLSESSSSSSSSPSTTGSSDSASSSRSSSVASPVRCSPQLMDEDVSTVVGSFSAQNSVVAEAKFVEANLEDCQQLKSKPSMTDDRSINDYSSSPSSSQLSARNSLLNSSASGSKVVSNFVRNSCPSRSINFGHSSSYLERYRSAQQQQQQQLQLQSTDNVANSSSEQQQQLHHGIHPAFAHNFIAHQTSGTGVMAVNAGQSSPQNHSNHPLNTIHQQSQQQQQQQHPQRSSYISQVQAQQQVNYESGAHMLQIGAKLNYVSSRQATSTTTNHNHQQQLLQQHQTHQHHQPHPQQMHHQLHHLDQSFNTMSLNRHARGPADHHRLASALVDADYLASPHTHMLGHHHHHHHMMPIIHQHPVVASMSHHGLQSPVNGNKNNGVRLVHNNPNDNGLSPLASHQQSPHMSSHHPQRVPLVWPLQNNVVDASGANQQHPSLVQHANGIDNDARYSSNTPNRSEQQPPHHDSDINGLAIHPQVRQHHHHQLLMASPGSGMVHPHHTHHHHNHLHPQQHHHQQLQQQQQQQQVHNNHHHHHHHRRSHDHHHHHLCQSRTMYTVSPIDSPVNIAVGTQETIGLPEVNDNPPSLRRQSKLLRQQQNNQRNSSASESSSAESTSSSSSSSSSSFSNLSSNASVPNEDIQRERNGRRSQRSSTYTTSGSENLLGNRDNENDNENNNKNKNLGQSLSLIDGDLRMSKHSRHSGQMAVLGPLENNHLLSESSSSQAIVSSYDVSSSCMVKMSKISNTTQLLNNNGIGSVSGASVHTIQPASFGGDNNKNFDVKIIKKQQQQQTIINKKKITNDCDNNNYLETSASMKTKHQSPRSAQQQSTINKTSSPKNGLPSNKSKLLFSNAKDKLSPTSNKPVKSSANQGNNGNNNGGNSGESAIWYEYGCV